MKEKDKLLKKIENIDSQITLLSDLKKKLIRILTGYGYTEQIGEGMQLFKKECDKHPFKPKHPEYREWTETAGAGRSSHYLPK